MEGLAADVIGEDEIVPIVTPHHPLLTQTPCTLMQLCQQPMILRESGSGTRAVVERALAARANAIRPVMSLGNIEAIKRAVMAGIGVAFVSRLAIGLELSAGRLAVVPLEDFRLTRPLHRLRRHGGHQTRAARAFLAELSHTLFTQGLTQPNVERYNDHDGL
jgi:DNA-binding transcriptional LysR family regulator